MMTKPLEGSENDFSGSADDWELRVFKNATSFRLHRYHGMGAVDTAEVDSFPAAIATAIAGLEDPSKPRARVLIYAIAESGRFVCIPQARWERYLQLWTDTHPKT